MPPSGPAARRNPRPKIGNPAAGKPSATLKPKTEASILNQAGLPKGQP